MFYLIFSGGKDSCFNMLQCVKNGHEIVALANLKPPQNTGVCMQTSEMVYSDTMLIIFVDLRQFCPCKLSTSVNKFIKLFL